MSISDDTHHVTEAIGDIYGEPVYGKRDSRPLSFLPGSSLNDTLDQPSRTPPVDPRFGTRHALARTASNDKAAPQGAIQPGSMMSSRSKSFASKNVPISPKSPARERSPSDTANQQFPLNDLDYESDPAAVAQELSNLQALRRMSMDVNAAGDPDLPTFNSSFGMPTVAPTGEADENDASRLFWVPARLHPELAPTEFKTFLDSRVNSIKRRSEDRLSSVDNPHRQGSGGGLRRKKSMLSRQIDNSGGKGAEGYTDGAERLDRKRSLSGQDALNAGISNLQELEVLVNDSSKAIQRLSLDAGSDVSPEALSNEDKPILPAAPPGNSLRRSTRTTYRRGSLRKGERVLPSKRATKSADPGSEDSTVPPPITPVSESLTLSRVQTEPAFPVEKPLENFSRPGRINRGRGMPPGETQATPTDPLPMRVPSEPYDKMSSLPASNQPPKHFVSQIASNGRSSLDPQIYARTVPQIVKTPPPQDQRRSAPPTAQQVHLPPRVSSHEPLPSMPPQGALPTGPSSPRVKRPITPQASQNEKGNQTLNEMASRPSPLPGNSTRTGDLSFIPTFAEEKKPDNKKANVKKEKEIIDGSRKSSWSWGSLLGSEEKEKEKRKEEEAKDAKKMKLKHPKIAEKSHDNTRLDVLQTTLDNGKGRESLVLDRGDLKLEEERKKESSRKSSSGDSKKEKDSGLFSSIFGGGKKKGDRESSGKKYANRNLSPEPPQRILKPDIDYNWTRFSILEERAIYRMAHIKLANPRRPLHSQVLLSNFMYSYLAKVQQMHPQIQVPQTAAQKRQQQQQQQQKKADQPEEFSQYQKYQAVCSTSRSFNSSNANFSKQLQRQQQQEQEQEQAQLMAQGQLQNPEDGGFNDDSSMYSYDAQDRDSRYRPQSRASQHSIHGLQNGNSPRGHTGSNYTHHSDMEGPESSPYQYQQSQFEDPERGLDDDMW